MIIRAWQREAVLIRKYLFSGCILLSTLCFTSFYRVIPLEAKEKPKLSHKSSKKTFKNKKIITKAKIKESVNIVSSLRSMPKDMLKTSAGGNTTVLDLAKKHLTNNISASDVYPFVSDSVLYGINLNTGTPLWRKIVHKNSFVYGIDYTNNKYIFFVVQDEVSRSAKFIVLDRLSGKDVGTHTFWGDLSFFHDYQRKLLTVKGNDGNYYSFLVMRKGRGVSKILKISFYPAKHTFDETVYQVDSVITSPLSSQKLIQNEWSFEKEIWEDVKIWNIFWAEKDGKTGKNYIGTLSRTSKDIKKYPLIDDGPVISQNYNIRNPVALFKSASNLYLFISMNKIFFRKEKNERAKLKNLYKQNPKLEKSNLVGIYKLKAPYKTMELSPYKYTPVDGHILFSPGVFKAPGNIELFYLYYFSALPVEEGTGGIKNILTLFEPMFWNGQIYVGPQSFSFGGEEDRNSYNSSYLGIPSIYRMQKENGKHLKVMFIPSNDIDVFSYRKKKGGVTEKWLREYSYNDTEQNMGNMFLGVSNKPVKKINNSYIVSSNFKGKNRLYAFDMVDAPNNEFPYSIRPKWVFEGGRLVSAPLSFDEKTGSLLNVSKRSLDIVVEADFHKKAAVSPAYTSIKSPANRHPEILADVSSQAVRNNGYIYWASGGIMFRKKGNTPAELKNGKVEKFAELGKNISTDIGFGVENFYFGTDGEGVQVYTFDRVNYYPFFIPDGRVSSKPVSWNRHIYFATEGREENYFYSMSLNKENFFLLPNYAWNSDKLDKNFSEASCYRFKIPSGRIVSAPVMGNIQGRKVWFVGTTTGTVYAIPMAGDISVNANGEIEENNFPWVAHLSGMNESIKLPLVYDDDNKLIFAVSNQGWVSVFDLKTNKLTPSYRWPFTETNDTGVFESSGFSVSDGCFAVNVVGKNFHSSFYAWNYFSKKYLRVPVLGQLTFPPVLVGSRAHITTRNGKILSIDLSEVTKKKQTKKNINTQFILARVL